MSKLSPASLLLLPLITAGIVVGVLTTPTVVTAQSESEETPKASESAATEELKKRIEKIVEEKREQVKGVIDKLTAEKRAMIGEVQRVTDETLTIQSSSGTAILPLENVALLKNDRPLAIDDVAVGNWVTVIGSREKNSVQPDFIFVSSKSLQPKPQVVLIGTITQVSRSTLTVQPRAKETAKTIRVTSATDIQTPDGEAAALSDLANDLTILVAGFATEENVEASTIRSLAPLE